MPATRAKRIAGEYLQGRGLTILERNYRRRLGEIDLVAPDQGVLVIAAVRTRTSAAYGGAAAASAGASSGASSGPPLNCRSSIATMRPCR
jgi:putative endonuclease